MQIYSVQDVRVFRKSGKPLELIITATGLAATTGWTNPRLDDSTDPKPADAVFELSFEADRPSGISLQVLTPVSATHVVKPTAGADVVIVKARTNSITVHASEFIDEPTAAPAGAESFTTMAVGEEMPPTFVMPGSEGLFPTTLMFGEEHPTTRRIGEEITTQRFGEEGPWTDPRVDDPMAPMLRPTFGAGEDPRVSRWPGIDPFSGGGGPFGGF